MDIRGKHAFITGAASGVGFGIAKACAANGMKVCIADKRKNAIGAVMPWFSENGYEAKGLLLDVTDRESFVNAANEAESLFGPIHLLFNNAGVQVEKAPLWENTDDDVDFIMGVNIKGVINGIKTIVPRMLDHGESSHVVSTASLAGLIVISGSTLYNMSKAAVAVMMETLACDLQGTNIGVSTFFPGWVQTDLLGTSLENRPPGLSDKTKEFPRKMPPRPALEQGEEYAVEPDVGRAAVSADEAGECAVQGIRRGDLFIFMSPEYKDGMRAKFDSIIRAFPTDAEPDPERVYVYRHILRGLINNPIYDLQQQR